ncbi:heterokaryon incompatibility protein-domain-containing protein [Hypoxylon rubiginosum]|uniref:Heterokaryon incompatibility protein-domain-containing protein n=1 Tax=Hypoxylon rubiginosum TaxID=110542 RepID=A0ACC0CZ72_9PEZI|nr:heterokaryon incompatibility protein-domain-containing protein [Hypoxylon rubiginosum]
MVATEAPTSSLYQPLDTSRPEIRLINILPSNETIRCTLQTESLSPDLKYAALSYVWGNPEDTEQIIVNDEEFSATKSLYEALRQFCSNTALLTNNNDTTLPLWVDAICINQNDSEEKSHQVQLMGSIYSSATRVLSWLGVPGVENGDTTIRMMRNIVEAAFNGERKEINETSLRGFLASQPHLLRLNEDQDGITYDNALWRGIRNLFERSYWSRIWIVQEMVLARKANTHLFICGSESITFETMENMSRTFDSLVQHKDLEQLGFDRHVWDLAKQFRSPFTAFQSVGIFRQVQASGASLDAGQIPFYSMCLQATDSRDFVYGFQAITSSDLTVDYKKTTKEVYLDWYGMVFRQWTPTKDGQVGLHPIVYAGLGLDDPSKSGLPSWLPNLARFHEIFEQTYLRNLVLYNRMSSSPSYHLQDQPGVKKMMNNAWSQIQNWIRHLLKLLEKGEPSPNFETPSSISDVVLQISGVRCCGIITEVIDLEVASESSPWPESLHKLCLDILNTNLKDHPLGISALQALFYLIYGGHDPVTERRLSVPPDPDLTFQAFRCLGCKRLAPDNGSGWKNAQFKSYQDLESALDANICKDMKEPGDLEDVLLDILDPEGFMGFRGGADLYRFMVPSKAKAIFQTEDGYMGIGPKGLKKDDQPCILKDVTFPLLIRGNDDGKYSNVGLTYIYGLRHDAIADKIKKGVVETQRFEIV